ncbi:peptidoglycan DD-metalloendopeptidase family protein [Inquilinus sp. CAU 1745]|uniref:murein hydrolase activator EnvC family protein n=1 Tax=Inquilinus sp. CAU 1745 TaxID=3140369 RepID=UPI00325B4E08
MRPALLLALSLLLCAPSAGAQDADADAAAERLREVEQGLEAGRAREAELARDSAAAAEAIAALRADSIEAARRVMARQGALMEIGEDLATLERQEADLRLRLSAGRDRLARLLSGLARLGRTPPEALLVRPGAPLDVVRGATVLSAAIPALEAEAATVRRTLADLEETRIQLDERRLAADEARRALNGEIARLNDAVAQRTEALALTEAERAEAAAQSAALAGEAADIRELIARLEAEEARRRAEAEAEAEAEERRRAEAEAAAEAAEEARRLAAEAAPPASATFGGMPMPVAGSVVLRYGEADRFGEPARGLRISTVAGAPVVAPIGGTVRFAGPFRGYGRILILQHPGGYHSLIGGLDIIDAVVGQQIAAGEPVGTAAKAAESQTAEIYFEFRRDGQPVNPVEGLSQAQERG